MRLCAVQNSTGHFDEMRKMSSVFLLVSLEKHKRRGTLNKKTDPHYFYDKDNPATNCKHYWVECKSWIVFGKAKAIQHGAGAVPQSPNGLLWIAGATASLT